MVISALAAPALACSCAPPNLARNLRSSEKVFVGRILSVSLKRIGGPATRDWQYIDQTVTFEVTRAWKGVAPGERVIVQTQVAGGNCQALVVKPSPENEDFQTMEAPPPPGVANTAYYEIDYDNWVIFDEPDICSLSRPLAGTAPQRQALFAKIDRAARRQGLSPRP